MKAITIKQPWASLICSGIKDIENRTWKTNFRGRVLIHAGATDAGDYTLITTQEQRNEIMGYGWTHGLDSYKDLYTQKSAILGSVVIADCVINHPSIWAEKTPIAHLGKLTIECQPPIYNWVLANPIMFEKPIPAKGKLSFWEFNQGSEFDNMENL